MAPEMLDQTGISSINADEITQSQNVFAESNGVTKYPSFPGYLVMATVYATKDSVQGVLKLLLFYLWCKLEGHMRRERSYVMFKGPKQSSAWWWDLNWTELMAKLPFQAWWWFLDRFHGQTSMLSLQISWSNFHLRSGGGTLTKQISWPNFHLELVDINLTDLMAKCLCQA